MLLTTIVLLASFSAASAPLQLHPDNPHYFRFRDRATVLITSGEHYGAVLNLDFDFRPYLDELKRCGFNLTRTFSGTYREVPGSFRIRDNTLAPKPGRFSCPWAQRQSKFDLDHFNDDHFRRLRTFVTEASRLGIVVEYVLFCPLYEDMLWDVNPLNAKNNINGVGLVPREQVYTLHHPDLLERQLAFVRKAVAELNEFDNVYYEICNEPYFGGVTLDWQRRVADAILAAEKDLPNKHLIAQNIANGSARISDPHPAVSVFNFHYASPPDAVLVNWHLQKPITFDETGFKGTQDRVYRRQAWDFLMAGGAVFSNLDYSFTPEHEDGRAQVEEPTPGGGGATLRRQLGILKHFLDRFELSSTSPAPDYIAAVEPRDLQSQTRALVDRQRRFFGFYIPGGSRVRLELDLDPGSYLVEWIDPRDGRVLKSGNLDVSFMTDRPARLRRVTVESPEFTEDVAVRIFPRRDSKKKTS
jgi:hypothetical protein